MSPRAPGGKGKRPCNALLSNGGPCKQAATRTDGRCRYHTRTGETFKTPSTAFKAGSERARAAGRKGGAALAAKKRQAKGPYEGTILDMMDAAGLTGPSWATWRVFLKAVFALAMTEAEVEVYRRHTERESAPQSPVDEAWMPVGRRGGKSRIAALVALFLAIRFDASRLAPGELAVVPVIAADRKQARAVLGYVGGFLAMVEFAPWLEREPLKESVALRTGVSIETFTASYRTTRGPTVIGCVCDEIAFWRTDDGAANPDSAIVMALRPAMATVGDALLLGLSSPYAAVGELFKAHERSFGKDDPHVLVWNADTQSMNPAVPAHIIDRAFEEDPVAAASEYGSEGRVLFRTDVSAFLDPAAVRAVTVEGRRELPPGRHQYFGFVDPSGGSRDSFTLAIAHSEGGRAVLDCVREIAPPFSPDNVTREFAAVLRAYGLSTVTGDRYALGWVVERFSRHGVKFTHSVLTKSDLYLALLPLVNAATCELLDLPVLHRQLVGLERRTARGGKDSIDHARNGRDDVANAVAGAVTLAAPQADTGRQFYFSTGSAPTKGQGLGTGLLQVVGKVQW